MGNGDLSSHRVIALIPIEVFRVLISLTMLGYASWSDLRTREVSDYVWLVFGGVGLVIDIFQIASGVFSIQDIAVPILFSSALSFALGYLGLFGGADFKAFVTLALLHPHRFRSVEPYLKVISFIHPLTVFSNSALAGASFSLIVLFKNLAASNRGSPLFEGFESESTWRKGVVLFSGIKIGIDSVRGPPFQYPLEVPSGKERKRTLVIMPDIEDDDSALEMFRVLRASGVKEVWVSQTLPFLVFIAFGYVCSLLFGDLALWMLVTLFSI